MEVTRWEWYKSGLLFRSRYPPGKSTGVHHREAANQTGLLRETFPRHPRLRHRQAWRSHRAESILYKFGDTYSPWAKARIEHLRRGVPRFHRHRRRANLEFPSRFW